MKFAIAMVLAAGLFSCTSSVPVSKKPAVAAAKVENRVKESDLTLVKLSPEAEKRLGIEIAAVSERNGTNQMTVAGEIMPIPGKAFVVSSPASGVITIVRASLAVGQSVKKGEPLLRLTPMLAPQRDLRVTLDADVRSARARLDNATQQRDRARQLLRDLAGSQRNVETADQEFAQAKAGYDAAVERLKRLDTHPFDAEADMTIVAPADGIVRQIQVSQGQNVTSGAILFEVANLHNMWLRVPVYAPDLKDIALAASVEARDVDGTGPARRAQRILAPPTADPLAATADLYFVVSNVDLQLRPGQRLSATLPLRASERKGLSVPLSAILYDINGGVWVYVKQGAQTYRRQRVELVETAGQTAYLSRGLRVGMNVVTQGAAELFGTEFGAGR